MIADYYLVRRGHLEHSCHKVEQWNWAGVITLHVAAIVGIVPISTSAMPLGFLVSLALALLLYPLLRKLLP